MRLIGVDTSYLHLAIAATITAFILALAPQVQAAPGRTLAGYEFDAVILFLGPEAPLYRESHYVGEYVYYLSISHGWEHYRLVFNCILDADYSLRVLERDRYTFIVYNTGCSLLFPHAHLAHIWLIYNEKFYNLTVTSVEPLAQNLSLAGSAAIEETPTRDPTEARAQRKYYVEALTPAEASLPGLRDHTVTGATRILVAASTLLTLAQAPYANGSTRPPDLTMHVETNPPLVDHATAQSQTPAGCSALFTPSSGRNNILVYYDKKPDEIKEPNGTILKPTSSWGQENSVK